MYLSSLYLQQAACGRGESFDPDMSHKLLQNPGVREDNEGDESELGRTLWIREAIFWPKKVKM